jgi:hypothetical protein
VSDVTHKMKTQVKEIKGVTTSGRIGTRYEHNIKVGNLVRHSDGREGEVVGDGFAGMPEVKLPDGHTVLWCPYDIDVQ